MVGTDGIIIASDTKWVATPPVLFNQTTGLRVPFGSSKILVNFDNGIVASYAMNMEVSFRVASEALSLEEKDWAYPIVPLESIGDKVLTTCGARSDAHCLIAFVHPVPQLFLFSLGMKNGEPGGVCHKIETTAFAGDNLNAAIFWAEGYYQRGPILNLASLAAHLILAAGKINTAMISGLEVVLLDSSGIRRVSDDSIHELERRFREWDKRTGAEFLSKQQLTYAPLVGCSTTP
jgi:hypothetical protein